MIYYILWKLRLMMVNLQIRYGLLYFHLIMSFRNIMAGLICLMVVVLLLLIRNLFIILFLSTSVLSTFKCIGSVVTSSNNLFKLFVVYHSPLSSMSTFFTAVESFLEFYISFKVDLIFLVILIFMLTI